MAGGKETPRQKMIGMMYLVLTALLAMNVSKDILHAFVIVNDSLMKTNANFDSKNDITSNAFELAMLNDEKKTKPFYTAAKAVRTMSRDLDKFIIQLKAGLIAATEDIPKAVSDTIKLAKVGQLDNYMTPTTYMIGDDERHPTGKSVELKDKINKYRADMLNLIKTALKKPGAYTTFEKQLGLRTNAEYNVFEEMEVSWEENLFYHAPLAAVITHLSRLQNEIKNCEGDAINMLYGEISAADFKFDKLDAKVVAPSSYILAGSEYTADIFVAAFSTTQNPQVWLGEVDTITNTIKGPIDSTTVKVDGGIGTYTVKTVSEGTPKYGGLIRIKKPDNTISSYRFNSKYTVARPAASVSPEKMNVFYIGVDNPVAITAAGVSPGDLLPSMTGGSLSKGAAPGKYTVRVSSGTTASISVGAKVNGKQTNMGSFPFRVKRVPDPVGYFAGLKGDGKLSKGELTSCPGTIAKLENFDFDLRFDVISFDISAQTSGGIATESSNSNRVTAGQLKLLTMSRAGGRIYIENIKAKGPDGTVRSISGVNIKVK